MGNAGNNADSAQVRLLLTPLAALLALPLLPATPVINGSLSAVSSPSTADSRPLINGAGGPVRVTAVVRDAHGHLTFRHGRAADVAAARGLAGRWRHQSGVVAAAVDSRIRVTGTIDPMQPQQWALDTLHAPQLWAAGGAAGQTVAVVDTGVDAGHPDLAGVVLAGTDILGQYADGDHDPNGHGTHVSGIVAEVAGNGVGGAGLAQGARILPVRVMAADGSGWGSDAAKGVVWAADHGANVINLSFGSPDRDSVLDTAISYALGKGVSVVVAAGNSGTAAGGDPVNWPAADPGVIAVGAVDSSGVRPYWSSTGSHLAVVAPGVGIWSTVPGGYASMDGTSMATPYVSAAVALLRAKVPGLTPATVRTRLMATADDLGAPGFDAMYGAGRIDPAAAEGLTVTTAPVTTVTDPVVTAPSPAPSPSASAGPSPSASPAPTASPTAAPVVAPVLTAPVLSGRISVSRSTLPYRGALTVSTRALSDGMGVPGLAVRLDRRVNGTWVPTRSGVSGTAGLTSWVVNPDQPMDFRVVGDGWQTAIVHVTVNPVVGLAATTSGLAGRVQPGGVRSVALQVRHATGWVTFASTATSSAGSYRLSHRFGIGTILRAVVSGAASAPVLVRS
jgi:subtilisin family serine protease